MTGPAALDRTGLPADPAPHGGAPHPGGEGGSDRAYSLTREGGADRAYSLWRAMAPWGWRLLGAGLLGAATEAAGLGLMATATWLLVTAAGQPPITALTVAIVVVRALAIGRGALRYTERLAGHDAVLRIVTEVRARIFAALIDRPTPRSADALSRMVSDVDAVQDLVVRVALPLAASGFIAVIAVVVTSVFAPAVALVLGGGLLVTGLALPVLGARLAARSAARLAPLRAAYAVATVDLVHGAADLAAYGATARYEEEGAAQAARLSTVERALARRAFALDALSGIVTGLTAAAVLLVAQGQGIAPVWTAVLAISTLAFGELSMGMLAAARKAAEIRGSLRRVRELVEAAPAPAGQGAPPDQPARAGQGARLAGDPASGDQAAPPTGDAASTGADRPPPDVAPPGDGAIVLRDVSVAGRLRGISLEIRPGKRIAVIGPSGAGKSTLLGVIAGTIAPDSGTVSGTGAPYEVATGLLADAHLFHASVRDNLLLGKPSATDAELATAAGVAGIGDFFSRYPAEMVGEDGAELSGGQRQRLALARAVLAAPPVLLLDEPTEGLDPAQADSVLEAVLAHAGESAVVLVTHRLAHLDPQTFDEVVVLEDGRVVTEGPTY
jgi:ATP-binding cassette, subfamily C, bacterial CydC